MADDPTTEHANQLREQAQNSDHIGTSPFTFQDDAGAEIHLSTVEGAKRHFYGVPMTPKHQIEEVVLGPAPFGSPDPRTLGHRMVPLEDGPVSAAELDEDFVKMQKANFAGRVDTEQLDELTKDELLEQAEQLGVDVNKSATKDEIKQAIADQQEGNTGQNEGANQQAPEGDAEKKSYSGMNKAELLDEAKNRGLEVDESNSKAEIQEALENADNNNS